MAVNAANLFLLLSTCVLAAIGGRTGNIRPVPLDADKLADKLAIPDAGDSAISSDADPLHLQAQAKPKFGKMRRANYKKGKNGKIDYSPRPISKLPCGEASQVRSSSDKRLVCPADCPYYAQELKDDLYCTFKCVAVTECAAANPRRPIADYVSRQKVCRGPLVPNCHTYRYDGTDSCLTCGTFYGVGEDGQCHYRYGWLIWIIVVPALIAVAAVVVWLVNLILRPVSNKLGLKQGHAARSQAKITTPFSPTQARTVYPVPLTNLCRQEEVAGPGMLLHFNFQFWCMLWAFGVAFIWWAFVKSVDEDMFVLGTRRFGTARENCILVAWGYETQQKLMWAKVTFLAMAYVFTFVGSLLYSIRQQRMCAVMDAESKTMKDFVALLTGIPPSVTGADGNLETEIKTAVERAVGQKVVGVSVCWNYGDKFDEVTQALDQDLKARQEDYATKKRLEHSSSAPETFRAEDADIERSGQGDAPANLWPMGKFFYGVEQKIENLTCGDPPEPSKDADTIALLKELEVGGEAFIVFENEDSRNQAVEKGASGITFKGDTLNLVEVDCEPDTVNWENLGNTTARSRLIKLIQGFGWIFVALCVWATAFYGPYFYGQITFNYENGAMPPGYTGLIFTLVVCVGNVIMYEVCARVSDGIGFKTKDEREACYMVLYVIACTFNVILDFGCTYMVALKVARGMNFRTYFGVKIDDIPHFTEQFEAYSMQRILAQNAFDYAWPSTFLIPFILEPIVTVYLPYKVSLWFVRTHPEWTGRDAELWLATIPFDMGRYGDLQLNMLLGIMIFFFPSGYSLSLFLGMGFSHMYIYCFDHWKVLSAIPKVIYANGNVDWYSQWLMAPITAVLAMALAFKANGEGLYEVTGIAIILLCAGAWILHTVVHTALLVYVVPMFMPTNLPDPHAEMQYPAISEKLACNWFTANPVHCLRSKLIHKHSPPCSFMYSGKEHLLNYNKAIGCHFKDQAADYEDYDSVVDWKALKQLFSGKSQAGVKEDAKSAKDVK